MPIACVDFVAVRPGTSSDRELGLIYRESPYGRVWCHLGGRLQRGETIAAALQRHAVETIGVRLILPEDPQPTYVYQWFPAANAPTDGTPFGQDERKHAIGMAFIAEISGDPSPSGEALEFRWFPQGDLPRDLWPGCEFLFERLGFGSGPA